MAHLRHQLLCLSCQLLLLLLLTARVLLQLCHLLRMRLHVSILLLKLCPRLIHHTFVLLLHLCLLADEIPGTINELQREYIEYGIESCDQLTRYVNDMLDMTRIETGKLRIQPNEGISLSVASKIPGEGQGVGSVNMDFSYAEAFGKNPPEAYERLLLDCMRGDPTLFARKDEVEFSWEFVDPLLEAYHAESLPLSIYQRGAQGPTEADGLLSRAGHQWVPIG